MRTPNYEQLRTDHDIKIIDSCSVGLVEVGKEDDVERLKQLIQNGESDDKLHTACEIVIAWIKFAQDLKNDLEVQRLAGYL